MAVLFLKYKCWTKKQNYVKECFNDAQQSSETNLDAVIVQQNKSKLESATDLEKFFVKTQRKLDILQEKKSYITLFEWWWHGCMKIETKVWKLCTYHGKYLIKTLPMWHSKFKLKLTSHIWYVLFIFVLIFYFSNN